MLIQWDQRRLGRRRATDFRDHIMDEETYRAIPRAVTKPRTMPWHIGAILDQDDTSECTLYAAIQQSNSAPLMHKLLWTPSMITAYYEKVKAQYDEWPGSNYDGTSERAVQKLFQDLLLTGSYKFVVDEEMARDFLRNKGMLMNGTDWLVGMDTPDKHGYIEPTGAVRGGHEYVERWYYNSRHYKYPDTYEYVQSWGLGWGQRGIFRMKSDARKFLQQNGGDCIAALEPGIAE